MKVKAPENRAQSTLIAGTGLAEEIESAQLLAFFQTELRAVLANLQDAWDSGDRDQLYRLSHHLQGAAAGYGFPEITHAAADVQIGLSEPERSISALRSEVEKLIELCRNVVGNEKLRTHE